MKEIKLKSNAITIDGLVNALVCQTLKNARAVDSVELGCILTFCNHFVSNPDFNGVSVEFVEDKTVEPVVRLFDNVLGLPLGLDYYYRDGLIIVPVMKPLTGVAVILTTP